MSRPNVHHRGSVLAALAFVLSACSFFSDFPDVEPAGEGGTASSSSTTAGPIGSTSSSPDGSSSSSDATSSGSDTSSTATGSGGGGGDGGAGAGGAGAGGDTCPVCQSCFPAEGDCPQSFDTFVVSGDASAPDFAEPETDVTLHDIVEIDDGVRFVGHAKLLGAREVDVPDSADIVTDGGTGVGFVLDADGHVVVAARGCPNAANPEEVFFMSATRALASSTDFLVVAGGFEAPRLVFGSPSPDCDVASDEIVGPHTTNTTTPFIAWLDGAEVARQFSLAPGETAVTYLADVADFAGSDDGRVVAVGAGSGTVRGVSIGEDQLFVVATDGEGDDYVRRLDLSPCDEIDHRASYSGLDNSIAVDPEGQVWVAGTGCQVQGAKQNAGYVARIETEGGDPSGVIELMGVEGDDDLSITQLVVSDELVIVAGTFSGQPSSGVEPFPDEVSGAVDDGFVMAFPRDGGDGEGWDNATLRSWFSWLSGDGNVVRIHDLSFGDGHLYVAGSFESYLGIPGLELACFEGANAPFTRAFFAELDPETGLALWLRVEGFEASLPPETFFAEGTAIERTAERLHTVTRSHGQLHLGCGEGVTVTAAQEPPPPVTQVRSLALAPPR